ncbi:CHAT domain-containing protein [Nocardia suismassiliense]|uniref:CHAT domain-containing protein n=1 Tax=Nocardia suismassiliense TaxID=2077092 RepID=A0ABW6R5Q3_9NOCA
MQPLWGDADQDHRIKLAREWDDLVQQVRHLKGFQDFHQPKPAPRLLPAASEGPVVIVNISQWRCDALLVRASGVEPLPLPELSIDTVADRLSEFLSKLQAMDEAVQRLVEARHRAAVELSHANSLAAFRSGQQLLQAEEAADATLLSINGWLWETVAAPIMSALDLTGPPDAGQPWPRVWLCPTGPLTLLPLHAAGASVGESMIDLCAPSYTPSLQALLAARTSSPADIQAVSKRVLLVAVPELEGYARLGNSVTDSALTRLLSPERLTVLDDPSTTRAMVLEELAGHQVVHFDCHGDQNLNEPSSGGLRLADGTLSILDIANQPWRGELAGLAACKTAVGGIDLLDEAITLTAALHYTGYRHVLGTLWSVRNDVTRELFNALYIAIHVAGDLDVTRAPLALHTLVRRFRADYPVQPRLWAPFIHMGP